MGSPQYVRTTRYHAIIWAKIMSKEIIGLAILFVFSIFLYITISKSNLEMSWSFFTVVGILFIIGLLTGFFLGYNTP